MFKLHDLPSSQAWIRKLNASEAIAQVVALGMNPAETLEENRVLLGKMVKMRNQGEGETPKESDQGDSEEVTEAEEGGPRDALTSYPRLQDCQAIGPGEQLLGNQSAPTGDRNPPTREEQGIFNFSKELITIMNQMHLQTMDSISAAREIQNQPIASSGKGKLIFDMVGQMEKFKFQGPHSVLKFLYQVGDLVSLNLLGEKDILVAALVKTDGALRAIWSEAVAQGLDWGQLKQRVITDFFPPREKRVLIQETVYRLQKPHESMRDFVHDIRRATDILTPEFTEREVVTLTMQQVSPKTRSHFVMQTFPTTFSDLEQLGKISAEFSSLDEEYGKTFRETGGEIFQRNYQNNFHLDERRGDHRQQPYRPAFGPRFTQGQNFRGGNGHTRPLSFSPRPSIPYRNFESGRQNRPWGYQPTGNERGRQN